MEKWGTLKNDADLKRLGIEIYGSTRAPTMLNGAKRSIG